MSAALPRVAVVAHRRKSLGDGLGALHDELKRHGIDDPIWYEVDKSKESPKAVRRALASDAEIVFAWGGDGTVQRCADVLAGTGATLAILPAGTAEPPRPQPRRAHRPGRGGRGRPARRPRGRSTSAS